MFSIGDVSDTLHYRCIYFLSFTDFKSWHRFEYDVGYILVVWLDIGITSAPYLRQRVFIIHFTVLFVIAFSAFHSIRSRIFHPCIFDGAAFSVLAFSVAPKIDELLYVKKISFQAAFEVINSGARFYIKR